MYGRRQTDTPNLTTAETISRATQVAKELGVEVIPLMWAVEYINGITDELRMEAPKGAPICSFGDCTRNAFLHVNDTEIYRCVNHAWRADDSENFMLQFPNKSKAECYEYGQLRFFS